MFFLQKSRGSFHKNYNKVAIEKDIKKCKKETRNVLINLIVISLKIMQQLRLLNPAFDIVKMINFENIRATFIRIAEDIYEVLLEINSNKFIIKFQTTMNQIENLEIIAIKGFVELSINIIKTVKKIVYKLYFEF